MTYQPKTGQACSCKRGVQRDNCPSCEGTGWRVDFAAIRNKAPRTWTSVQCLDDKQYAQWAEDEQRRDDAREGFES